MRNKNVRKIVFSFKYNKRKYFIVTIIFLLSTSVYLSSHVIFLTLAFLVFGWMFFKSNNKVTKDFVSIFFALTLLNLANIIIFYFFSGRTLIGNYIRFLMPFFAVMLVGRYFPHYYVRVVIFFTFISFLFYLPANFFPGFNDLLQNIPRILGTDPLENNSFIIYRVEYARPFETNIPLYRNSGPTGEPGEFAGYLILAMIFEFIINRKFWTKNNIIFAIALFTTFSTTGYVAFFILLSAYYFMYKKIKGRIILFPLSIILAYYTYFGLEFMHSKVEQQIQIVEESGDINEIPRTGRIPNMIKNLQDSFDRPFFGKGRNFRTRYGNYELMNEKEFANNTFSFPVQFGWPFFLFYSFLIIKGFKNILIIYRLNPRFSYVFLLIIFTLSTSQGFLLTSFFISLLYIRDIYPDINIKTFTSDVSKHSYTYS